MRVSTNKKENLNKILSIEKQINNHLLTMQLKKRILKCRISLIWTAENNSNKLVNIYYMLVIMKGKFSYFENQKLYKYKNIIQKLLKNINNLLLNKYNGRTIYSKQNVILGIGTTENSLLLSNIMFILISDMIEIMSKFLDEFGDSSD